MCVALLLTSLALLLGPLSLPAAAQGVVSTFDVQAELAADGTLHVRQSMTFSGSAPAGVSQKFELRQDIVGQRQYVMTLDNITATAGGKAITPGRTDDGRFSTITLATGGANRLTMSYTVTGVVRTIDSGTALQWALLQGLSARVTEFTATVEVP